MEKGTFYVIKKGKIFVKFTPSANMKKKLIFLL